MGILPWISTFLSLFLFPHPTFPTCPVSAICLKKNDSLSIMVASETVQCPLLIVKISQSPGSLLCTAHGKKEGKSWLECGARFQMKEERTSWVQARETRVMIWLLRSIINLPRQEQSYPNTDSDWKLSPVCIRKIKGEERWNDFFNPHNSIISAVQLYNFCCATRHQQDINKGQWHVLYVQLRLFRRSCLHGKNAFAHGSFNKLKVA